MNKERFSSQNRLMPINKSVKQSQIHNDYPNSFSAIGHLITSNSTTFIPEFKTYPKSEKMMKNASLNCIQRALAQKSFYNPLKEVKDSSDELYFSRKPRVTEYAAYTTRDYREFEKTAKMSSGGLGPSRLGSVEWESEKLKLTRSKLYSDSLRNSHHNYGHKLFL
jgi:hypothetical protein